VERQPGHDPGVIVPVKNYGKTSPKCSVLVILPPVPIKNTKTRCRPAQQMFLDDLAAGRLHMVSSVTVSGVSHDNSAWLANDVSEILRNCLAINCGCSQNILVSARWMEKQTMKRREETWGTQKCPESNGPRHRKELAILVCKVDCDWPDFARTFAAVSQEDLGGEGARVNLPEHVKARDCRVVVASLKLVRHEEDLGPFGIHC
jgi:hypothetical protein